MAKKKALTTRQLRSSLRNAYKEGDALWQALANARIKLSDVEATLDFLQEENSRLRSEVSRLAQLNGEAGQKIDALTRLLKANDSACENLTATVEKQTAHIETLQAQLNTVLGHREAILDALSAARVILNNQAQANREN